MIAQTERRTDYRPLSWLLPCLLPLILLAIWLSQPAFDLRVPASNTNPFQNPVHFWLIASVGVLSLGLGLLMSAAARRRDDARMLLVSLSMLSAAGFVLLHALATPNILVTGRNVGFVIAAPVGLLIASLFAAASAFEFTPVQAQKIIAGRSLLRGGVLGFTALFGVLALLQLPPLSLVPNEETNTTPLLFCLIGITPLPALQVPATVAVLAATLLFGWAGSRYLQLYARRPSVALLGLSAGLVMMAVTALNLGLSRTWRLTWWQWHVLLLVAFGLLAYSAYRQYRREGSARQIYDSVYLEETVRKIRQEYSGALETLVASLQRSAEDGETLAAPATAEVARRFDLSDGQVRVLEQAAEALASERDQITRLGALVAVGQETSVIVDESQLLQRALAITGSAFRREALQVGLVNEGRLEFPPALRTGEAMPGEADETRRQLISQALRTAEPAEKGSALVLPLTVKGRAAGVLEVRRRSGVFAERDRYLLRSLASQLSVALENARLYHQLDGLFRQYMPASVATALIADPNQAALGGAVTELSVMFGDLRGFTTLSERLAPPELVRILNRYYGAASQVVLAQGGTIDKFMGDAMMALFNAPTRQPDHALRACRAAMAMQRAVAPIAAESADMPRFGIGITTGEALVGNIGSEQIRNFTAIGDTVNLASRLQSRAQGGQVLISAGTYAQVKEFVQVQPLGAIQVKGREEAVEAFVLLAVQE